MTEPDTLYWRDDPHQPLGAQAAAFFVTVAAAMLAQARRDDPAADPQTLQSLLAKGLKDAASQFQPKIRVQGGRYVQPTREVSSNPASADAAADLVDA